MYKAIISRSVIGSVFKFKMYKLEVYYLSSENKGADQTAWASRLICAVVFRNYIYAKTNFLKKRLKLSSTLISALVNMYVFI